MPVLLPAASVGAESIAAPKAAARIAERVFIVSLLMSGCATASLGLWARPWRKQRNRRPNFMVRGVLDGGRAPLDGRLRVGTNGVAQPPNGVWQSTGGSPCERRMLLVLTFLLGAGNFALHKAVLESRHPLLGRVPWFVHMLGGRGTLVVEFLM